MIRLKELCQERGITQRVAARDLGIRENTFSQYVTEQRQADYRTLAQLADYFDCSIDYLLGRSDVKRATGSIVMAARSTGGTPSFTPSKQEILALLAELIKDEPEQDLADE